MSGYSQSYGMFPICCNYSGTSGGSSGGSTTPTGAAGGSLSGTYPNPTLANTGVVAGTYGSATQVPVFTVNSAGQLTTVTNTPISILSSQITDLSEAVQDIVGTAFIDSANIDFTYNDPANQITADLTNTTVAPGTYTNTTITVDQKGRITAAATGSGASVGDTDGLPEGVTNLYFSNERAQDAIGTILQDTATIDFTYNDVSNIISASLINTAVVPGTYTLSTITVDQQGRITAASNGTGSSLANTDGLPEGTTNLYFTTERAQDAVGNILVDSANIDFTYNDAGNTITSDLTNTGVVAGVYGDASNIPVITIDSKGRVTTVTEIPASSVTNPAGANKQIQFNNGGVFGADPNLVYDPTTDRLGLGTSSPVAKQDITGQADEVQLKVTANSTQTNDIFQVQNSTGLNQVTVANNGAIELGTGALATKSGQIVHANGNFATPGDAQSSEYPLRISTSTGTQTPLSIDGITEQITIPVNKTIIFSGIVGARSSTGDTAYWEIRGAIKNNAGTTSLVGTPLVSYIASDSGALTWNSGDIYSAVTVNANDTTDSLNILVTGESGVTIRWNSFIKTVEIGF